MRSILRRLARRHTTAVAYVALFAALGGSAYAAVTVTGKQIKDGTVTGKDVKNRSLGAGKLSASALGSLAGERGPAGPQGAPGPKGDPGQAGPDRPGRRDRRPGTAGGGRRHQHRVQGLVGRERPEGWNRRRPGELHLGQGRARRRGGPVPIRGAGPHRLECARWGERHQHRLERSGPQRGRLGVHRVRLGGLRERDRRGRLGRAEGRAVQDVAVRHLDLAQAQ